MIDFNIIYNVPSGEENSDQDAKQEIENFRKKELDLLDLSDRDLFASEIDLMCQAMYKTARDLQRKGMPHDKIRDEIKQSIDKSRTRLHSSIAQFKTDKAIILKSSETFHERASNSQVDFAPIQAKPLSRRVSRPNQKSSILDERKQKLAACVQLSDASVPQGASYCLNEFSKGLSNEEQQELASIVPRAMVGKSTNEACAPLAAFKKVADLSAQAVYLASVSGFCAETSPGDYDQCVSSLRNVCEGKDSEVNKAVAEAMPQWVIETGEFFGRIDRQIMEINNDMESTYYTSPGLVYEGIHGGITAGLPLVGKGGITLGKSALQGVKKVSQVSSEAIAISSGNKVLNFLQNESGAIKLNSNKGATKKIPTERREIIKQLKDENYTLVKGGKGSHEKYKKAGHPTVIVPKDSELKKGTATSILNASQTKTIHSPSALNNVKMESNKPAFNFSYDRPLEHRFDYSKGYRQAAEDFKRAKEFNGVLKDSLLVIRYHGPTTSHKWYTTAKQANKMFTVDDFKNAVAKIDAFGEVTHATLAEIPAGTPVRFLYGKAVQKMDDLTDTLRPGGGAQIRFFDFDPNWIVTTKKLTD